MCTSCDNELRPPEPVPETVTPGVEQLILPGVLPEPEPEPELGACEDCGERFDPDDLTDIGPGTTVKLVCEDCRENYFTCDHCDAIVDNDDATTVGDDVWCDDCARRHAFTCGDCDRVRPDDESVGIDSPNKTVCQSCYESNNYFNCDSCNNTFDEEHYGSDGNCTGCEPEEEPEEDDDPGPILDYTNRRANNLGPFGPGPLRFGVELEVECVNGCAPGERATLVLGRIGTDFAVCKHDGSLSNGFEIVTAPADLATHRKRWTDCLGSRMRGLRSWDTTSCGMHIHVSRNALSRLTIGKLLVFVNAHQNTTFVEAIAGRKNEYYARRHPKKVSDAHRTKPVGERYSAINLQNDRTIEFRIFKGTLLLAGVLKNLEFVAALIEFCKQTSVTQLGWVDFVRHVGKSPKAWPHLVAWLRDHQHIAPAKVRPGHVAPVAEAQI